MTERRYDMDFPGNCPTNVQKIENYATVPYQVYSLNNPQQDDGPLSNLGAAPPATPPVDPGGGYEGRYEGGGLNTVESWCRNTGALVMVDYEKQELWLFGKPSTSAVPERLPGVKRNPQQSDGFFIAGVSLKRIGAGALQASSLNKRHPFQGQKPPIPRPPPLKPSAPDPIMRAAQVANAQALQANSSMNTPVTAATPSDLNDDQTKNPDQGFDPTVIYQMFISAVTASLLYQLAKSKAFIPLNYRTLLLVPKDHSQEDMELYPPTLVTLDVRLTTTGTLIISSSTVHQPGLSSLLNIRTADKFLASETTDVWLAPGGKVARYVGVFTEIAERATENDDNTSYSAASPARQRGCPRTKLARNTRAKKWMADVLQWLADRGIEIENQEDGLAWIRVQIRLPSTSVSQGVSTPRTTEDDDLSSAGDELPEILWPASLCFRRTRQSEGAESGVKLPGWVSREDSQSWFLPPASGGVRDAFEFAQEWFLGRDSRENQLRAKQAAREAQDAARLASTSQGVDASNTPNWPRPGIAGDLQSVGGVYPTPPDGVHPGGIAGSTPGKDIHSQNDTSGNNGDQQELENRKESIASFTNQDPMRRDSAASMFDMSGNYDGNGDDLFGDNDQDMFADNGVTEADFSFFDEPDLDGLGEADVSGGLGGLDSNFTEDLDTQHHLSGEIQNGAQARISTDDLGDLGGTSAIGDMQAQGNSDAVGTGQACGTNGNTVDNTQGLITSGDLEGHSNMVLGGKRPMSPPLSPHAVMKRLFGSDQTASTRVGNAGADNRFDPVPFNDALGSFDKKYGFDGGRYWFESKGDQRRGSDSIATKGVEKPDPRLELPKRQSAHRTTTSADQEQPSSNRTHRRITRHDSADVSDEDETNATQGDLTDTSESDNQSDTASDMSYSGVFAGSKRKRAAEDDGDSAMTSSLQRIAFDIASDGERMDGYSVPTWDYISPDPWDWSLAGYFSIKENDSRYALELDGPEFIRVAQIFTDQMISGNMDLLDEQACKENDIHYIDEVWKSSDVVKDFLHQVVEGVFSSATPCNLRGLAAVEDMPLEAPQLAKGQIRPNVPPRRPGTLGSGGANGEGPSAGRRKSNIFEIAAPHVRVQRADTPMELLPSALSFWETFGLGPSSGPKDIVAFCIHPSGEGVQDAASQFLDRMTSVYDCCKFGSHTRDNFISEYERGLVPVILDGNVDVTFNAVKQALFKACTTLGKLLTNITAENKNYVIYMINPYREPDSLVLYCAAFSKLFDAYVKSLNEQQAKNWNEVVLQIIPMDIAVAKTTVVVPTQQHCIRLATEVYDRCVSIDVDRPRNLQPTGMAPAVRLAQPTPKEIEFKLTATPSSSILHENSCLHVAYQESFDGRWISAAWSDSYGGFQMTMSYCLGRKDSTARRHRLGVLGEIWEMSLDIMNLRKVHWRVFVVKIGVMTLQEMQYFLWQSTRPSPYSTTVTLLSANPSPPISLHPATPTVDLSAFVTHPANYTTPVSTPPQPDNTSPNNPSGTTPTSVPATANTPTPTTTTASASTDAPPQHNGELDPSAVLLDPTDTTYGVLLAFRALNAHSLLDYTPCVASALLLKRAGSAAGPRDDDTTITPAPPAVLAVNLLHPGPRGSLAGADALLREVLEAYRGLGTLARARNVVSPDSVLPWHIAVVGRAVRGLAWAM